MRNTTHQTRENRTSTSDFHDEAPYFLFLSDGKAFVACVRALLLALGFQRVPKATCRGGGCVTRPLHYARVCLGGLTLWRVQHVGQGGVEVEGGTVPTRDWFLNLQILTSGGLR